MRREGRSHIQGSITHTFDMVGISSGQMLNDISSGSGLHGTARTSLAIIIGIIDETQIVESAFVSPEIVVFVSGHHHGSFAALVLFSCPVFRIVNRTYTESILKRYGNASPASPAIIFKIRESRHCQIRLHGILLSPWITSGLPKPRNQAFLVSIVLETEHVRIFRKEITTGIVDHIACIFGSLRQVVRIQRTGKTGFCEIHLRKKTFRRIVIDTSASFRTHLRKKSHRLFQSHDYIFIYIFACGLIDIVVMPGSQELVVVMNDRNFSENPDHIEIGKSFPCERLTYALLLDRLRRTLRPEDILYDSIGMTVHGPQGIRHVLKVFISSVYGEIQILAFAYVKVSRHYLSNPQESSLEIKPRRVIKIIDALDALRVVLIEIVHIVVVLSRSVQEFIARNQPHGKDARNGNFRYICFHIAPIFRM